MSKLSNIVESKKHYEGVTLIERMQECHTLAISIAIIENYKISEVYAQGVKRRNSHEKISQDTLFQAGSISKPIFAVALMRLGEQGIIDLDTDISEYLVDYALPTYDNKKHKITLKQILCHHAGLNLHGFAGYQQGQRIPSIDQILNGAYPSNSLKLRLFRDPEVGYQYSGGGYLLAQKAVMDVCKCDFLKLMNDYALYPLNMTKSSFAQPLPKERLNEIAFGYNRHNLQLPGGYNIMPELSAAGLWATPSDLATLGIEIMNVLKKESLFLSMNTVKSMTSKVNENSPVGLGFVVNQSKKGVIFGHGGANYGYYSNMWFCPDDGSGIVVMHNSDIGIGILAEVVSAFKEYFDW